MSLDFVQDLLAEEEEGVLTVGELHAELFARLDDDNVDAVIAALPDPRRTAFVAWARSEYDNDVEPGMFLLIGGESLKAAPDRAFRAIRRWFYDQRHPR
jgi:hypothetical protein